jgi:P pilus assembly chaperone PapD
MGQTLEANASTGTVRIYNNNNGQKRIQIVVDALTVGADGQKIRTPSSDLSFYPASVITLKPGAVQTLRWKRNTPPSAQEKAYQIIITETPMDAEDAITDSSGMKVSLSPRILNPWVFVPAGAKPVLTASSEDGFLVFRNIGTATASLVNVIYAGSVVPGNFLVLPGERLKIKVDRTGKEVSFTSRGVAQSLAVE